MAVTDGKTRKNQEKDLGVITAGQFSIWKWENGKFHVRVLYKWDSIQIMQK